MAYRRSLSTKVTRVTQRLNPSIRYILHDDDDHSKNRSSFEDAQRPRINYFLRHGYHSYNNRNKAAGFDALFQGRGLSSLSLPMGLGSSSCSYSSASGTESDKVEFISDVAETISENVADLATSQGSAVSEVAIAAADSYFPIAALQYFIDGVHSFTGLNWWASIALTAIVIRGVTVPLLINQLKCTTQLTLMRPRLEEISREMKSKAMDPNAISEASIRTKELFREYGVTPLTPLRGLFIQGPIFISFYLAITNMVEKVPSFKEGGAFWFLDLTTPDSLYIFPVLTALTFLVTVECNVEEGLEGNPVGATVKNCLRVLAALTVPITMNFPKAIFCYWITSNLFSLVYGLVIKRPQVKKLLNIPMIPAAVSQEVSLSSSSSSSTSDQNIPTSSVIRESLKSLENEVKGKQTEDKQV